MTEQGRTAYVTGGASGIGRAAVQMLLGKGIKVCIADKDIGSAQAYAAELKQTGASVTAVQVDIVSWEQQVAAFESALRDLDRIDYVFAVAGIGEKRWLPTSTGSGWEKPNLVCLDADLTGTLYTVSLAVQQFRRQKKSEFGFRGKICCVASVCGFYCVPTIPVYTSAKHGVVGFTRSYGKYLPEEGITMNAVCPNVVRTQISSGEFYDKVGAKGLLTDMKGVLEAFEAMMGNSDMSGECLEVGPGDAGYTKREAAEVRDERSQEVLDMILERSHALVEP